ncbi:MAG: hypothetical protein NTY65_13895 [Planctomycetota bacterium]|jgi:hypothetical protein|nr:hypothetical protein [Planctomycetota bacterium]
MTVGLETFTRAMLEQAVRLYMEEAYGSAPVPAKVQARLAWPAGDSLRQLAAGDAFECVPADVPVDECDRIRLRLGNPKYPHMKLGVDRIPDTGDWVLAVDCHDRQLMAVVQDSERAALEAILRANNELKSRIERRWTDAGLPTFERYIRGRLAGCPRDESGTCQPPP